MASLYDKYYEKQPQAVKVITVGAVALLGYSVYRSIQRKADEKDANKAPDEAAKKLAELAAQGITPSYDDLQFQVFVSSLVDAMNGCGTDEHTVMEVFKAMQNDADIAKLIKEFGIQYYSPCAVSDPISWAISFFNKKGYGGNLPTWITYEMTGGEKETINSILAGNGVNYIF